MNSLEKKLIRFFLKPRLKTFLKKGNKVFEKVKIAPEYKILFVLYFEVVRRVQSQEQLVLGSWTCPFVLKNMG